MLFLSHSDTLQAQIQYDIEPLISKLSAVTKFDWIIYRLRNLWPKWVSAMRTLEQHNTLKHHRKRVSRGGALMASSYTCVCLHACMHVCVHGVWCMFGACEQIFGVRVCVHAYAHAHVYPIYIS